MTRRFQFSLRHLLATVVVGAFFGGMVPLGQDAKADDQDQSPAVVAYLTNATKHRKSTIEAIRSRLKVLSRYASQARVAKEEIKVTEAALRAAEKDGSFVAPEQLSSRIYAGFAGYFKTDSWANGSRTASDGTVVRIIDEQNAIIDIDGAPFWLAKCKTDSLAGRYIRLDGVYYVPGKKTCGTKSLLVLERFDERDVLPHLAEPQRESLRQQIEAASRVPADPGFIYYPDYYGIPFFWLPAIK